MGAIKTKKEKAKVTESPAMLPVFPLAKRSSPSVALEVLVPTKIVRCQVLSVMLQFITKFYMKHSPLSIILWVQPCPFEKYRSSLDLLQELSCYSL